MQSRVAFVVESHVASGKADSSKRVPVPTCLQRYWPCLENTDDKDGEDDDDDGKVDDEDKKEG